MRRTPSTTLWAVMACILSITFVGQRPALAAKDGASAAVRAEIHSLLANTAVVSQLDRMGYAPAAVERAMEGCSGSDLGVFRDGLYALSPRRALERALVADGHSREDARKTVAALSAEEVGRVVEFDPQRGGYFIIPTAYWLGMLIFSAVVALSDMVDMTPWNTHDDTDSVVVEFVREQYLKRKEARLKAKMQEKQPDDLEARDETRQLELMLLRRGEKPELPPL